ncbi:MAG: PAS domain-containing protein, partial [Sphingomonas sp.]
MSIASLLGEIALATGPAGAVSLMRLRTFAVLLLALAGWLASRSKAPRFVIALLAAGDLLVLTATILAIGGPSGGMTSAVLVAALATIATVGVASVGRRQREDAPLAALPGALTVNLAAFEAIVALERGIGLGFVAPGPATMLAGSLAFALLGAALLIQTTEDALAAMPENTPVEQRALRLIVPLLMVAPAIITFAVWLIDRTMSSEYLPQITATTIQTVLIASVLLWLLGRLTRERRALLEFTASVDLTPIALVDAEGRIVHWSKGCEELYGWPAEQAMGRPKHQLLQSRMVSGGGPIEASATGTELYERRRDGSFVQVLEKSLATPAGTGRPTRILSMTDLTERVTAERALRESEAHLTLAAHAHSIGIFDWEVDTGRMNWFGETERFLGLPIGTMRDYETWQSMV